MSITATRDCEAKISVTISGENLSQYKAITLTNVLATDAEFCICENDLGQVKECEAVLEAYDYSEELHENSATYTVSCRWEETVELPEEDEEYEADPDHPFNEHPADRLEYLIDDVIEENGDFNFVDSEVLEENCMSWDELIEAYAKEGIIVTNTIVTTQEVPVASDSADKKTKSSYSIEKD